MRVTSLIENETMAGRNELQCEFGLSLHIETGGRSILFDTGATGAFADNAAALGIDLGNIDLAVLSHQHFDHGGGLRRFLESNDEASVFVRDSEFAERFLKPFVVLKRPIGLEHSLFDDFPDRLHPVSQTTEVAPGVWLLTEIGTEHPRPRGNRRLFVKRDDRIIPDPFDHELVMVVREEDGIAVFSGCSHNGILNMVDAAAASFPGMPIKAVFGGFHLIGLPQFNTMAASRAEVEAMGRAMASRVDGQIFTGHCTGKKATRVLENVLGETLQVFPTGTTTEI